MQVVKHPNRKRKRANTWTPPLAYILGIDMSLTSPGVVTLNPETKTMHFYWLPSHVHELNIENVRIGVGPWSDWKIVGTCVNRSKVDEAKKMDVFNRAQEAIQLVVKALEDLAPHTPIVKIEGFAEGYGTTKQNIKLQKVQTMLKMIGGALRMELSKRGCSWTEIAPTSIKKVWMGKGRGDKDDMYRAWLETWQLPDLCTLILGGPRKWNKKTQKLTKIPHPIHDLVDALALAIA